MAITTYYWDMDGVLCNFHKEPYSYANAINRNWIANLDPFMDNVNTLRTMLRQGKSVYILTKSASKEARQGKIDWLAKYVPELPKHRFICIVGYGKKVDYMRTKQGILIDDDIKNIKQWSKQGHGFIHVETKGQKVQL